MEGYKQEEGAQRREEKLSTLNKQKHRHKRTNKTKQEEKKYRIMRRRE